MMPQYEYGTEVRVIRNIRNDGTYPGMDTGTLLIRRGSVGCVYDVGTYLQDQLIYKVHFLDQGRTVGCREEELILATDPWVPSKFEFRENVLAACSFSVKGEVVVQRGQMGSVMRVERDLPQGVHYEVHFGEGRVLLIPEQSLLAADENAEV